MELRTGDIIKTTCHIPLCYHLAVCVVDNDNIYVFSNAPSTLNQYGGNVVCQRIEDFLATRELLSVSSSGLSRQEIIQYTVANRKRKWDELKYNCEDYINEMLQNGDVTTQLGRVLAIGLLLAGLYILLHNEKIKK